MSSKAYESLKLFYLGKEESGEPILYENRDLNTHALIIGMTGSGKTGLGVGIIEEAALDGIPSIIIDPKGDMGNLLLAFPNLSAEEFKPWIDEGEIVNKNIDINTLSQNISSSWEKGIYDWDMDKSRVEKFKNSADFMIYTPGASIGASVSVLSSFNAPPKEVLEDSDFFNALVNSTVTGILGFVGINADPLTSKEHILLSSIFTNEYKDGKDLSMENIINYIVTPPFEKIGVFALESFMPKDKRLELAMKLNSIVASPSFAAWCEGESLDIAKLLMTKEGKPRVNIFSIAHLNDSERMFFVTLLLNNIISWMRQQEGTSSLRAILYMDEIFGFFPPSANPSSKAPMLILLKQARAFGLGVVLSTQNPVDLDYKGLSNIGTWFIGRLQTTQDKERVIDGLIGIDGSEFSKTDIMKMISNLQKRQFLLKNIHESGLKLFKTRWTLSYLKGPLSREQIKALIKYKKIPHEEIKIVQQSNSGPTKPLISAKIEQLYFYTNREKNPRMAPTITYFAKVRYLNAIKGVNKEEEFSIFSPAGETQNRVDWTLETASRNKFIDKPFENTYFENIANFMGEPKIVAELEKDAIDFIYRNAKLTIFKAPSLKLESTINESIEAFRLRIKTKLDEQFNEESKKLKESFEKEQKALNLKLIRANEKLNKEQSDVHSKTIDTVASIGISVLGSIFGRRSSASATKVASGVKNASRVLKEREDVKNVQNELQRVHDDIQFSQDKLRTDAQNLKNRYDASSVEVKEESISPRKTDIFDTKIALVWREV